MAFDYLPAISSNNRLLVPCIKHCGMVTCNPVVDDSLCMLMNFWAVIYGFLNSLTAYEPPWIQNLEPLYGLSSAAIGYLLGFYHSNPERSALAPVVKTTFPALRAMWHLSHRM